MKECKQKLIDKGLKPTKHRCQILKYFQQSSRPLSAEDIYRHCLESGRPINLSTVYRTLDALKNSRLIRSLSFEGSDRTLYQLKQRHIHYLMCLGCKKIQPVDYCPLENIEKRFFPKNFEITEHRLDIYGYCQDCKAK